MGSALEIVGLAGLILAGAFTGLVATIIAVSAVCIYVGNAMDR